MRRILLGGALLAGCGVILPPYTSCIARGSRVRVPRGWRNIEELQPGDEVLCADTVTRELVPAKLAATRMATRECVRLKADGTSLTLTSDHPVFDPDTGEWAPSGDWVVGKRTALLVLVDERLTRVEVGERSFFVGMHDVFDLSVDHPLHNFIAEGVVVHNKSPPPTVCSRDGGVAVYEGDYCECRPGCSGYVMCGTTSPSCNCSEQINAGNAACSGDAGVDGGTRDGGDGG